MRNIPAKLYASTPTDEPKEIVIGTKYFEELIPFLDLHRNRIAYVMVPELDRYEINNIVRHLEDPEMRKLAKTTKPSKLLVQVHKTTSAWDHEGSYTKKYWNLITEVSPRREFFSEEEEYDAEETNSEEDAPKTSYAKLVPQYKNRFGHLASHLQACDGYYLLDKHPFEGDLPRPFAYRVSAVYIKNSQAYILVLDTVLNEYIGVKHTEYDNIPYNVGLQFKEKAPQISPNQLLVYEALNGVGSLDKLLEELDSKMEHIFNMIPSVLSRDKNVVVYKEDVKLENIKIVYSDKEDNIRYEDLSTEKGKYKFEVGFYGGLLLLKIPSNKPKAVELLQRVGTDPEIYRIFSHNFYTNAKKSSYITDDTVKLFVKDFYHFHDGKSFPIREIKRQKQWEPASPPDIPAKYLAMEGNPVEIAIQCYLETGVGISYWNFRAAFRK